MNKCYGRLLLHNIMKHTFPPQISMQPSSTAGFLEPIKITAASQVVIFVSCKQSKHFIFLNMGLSRPLFGLIFLFSWNTLLVKPRHPVRIDWQQFWAGKKPKSNRGFKPSLPIQNAIALPLVPPLPLKHFNFKKLLFHLKQSTSLGLELRHHLGLNEIKQIGGTWDWALYIMYIMEGA